MCRVFFITLVTHAITAPCLVVPVAHANTAPRMWSVGTTLAAWYRTRDGFFVDDFRRTMEL